MEHTELEFSYTFFIGFLVDDENFINNINCGDDFIVKIKQLRGYYLNAQKDYTRSCLFTVF